MLFLRAMPATSACPAAMPPGALRVLNRSALPPQAPVEVPQLRSQGHRAAGSQGACPALPCALPLALLTRFGGQIAEAHAPEPQVPVVEPPPEDDAQEVLLSVHPKKANWDLRRDVERKLEKLEKRTQRALAELMRQEDAKRTAQAAGQA